MSILFSYGGKSAKAFMKVTKLSIIIPIYNEEGTVLSILDRVSRVSLLGDIKKEIILVNDCSSDNSKKKIFEYMEQNSHLDIHYKEHDKNKGKGAAMHTGISESSGEYLVVQDADLEYNPEEYNLLLQPVVDGVADVVYGSRFIGGNAHRILFFWHSLGNKVLTFLSNMLTNLNLTDMETCYKLIRSDIAKSLHLKERRFGFEPEITAKLSRVSGIRIYEVGISYYGRTYDEGKKIGWKDGFRAIYCILKYNLFTK